MGYGCLFTEKYWVHILKWINVEYAPLFMAEGK